MVGESDSTPMFNSAALPMTPLAALSIVMVPPEPLRRSSAAPSRAPNSATETSPVPVTVPLFWTLTVPDAVVLPIRTAVVPTLIKPSRFELMVPWLFKVTFVPPSDTAGESSGSAPAAIVPPEPTVTVRPLVLFSRLGDKSAAGVLQITDTPVVVHAASAGAGAIEKAPNTTPVRVNKGVPPTTFIRRDQHASMEYSNPTTRPALACPTSVGRWGCGTSAFINFVPVQSV